MVCIYWWWRKGDGPDDGAVLCEMGGSGVRWMAMAIVGVRVSKPGTYEIGRIGKARAVPSGRDHGRKRCLSVYFSMHMGHKRLDREGSGQDSQPFR